MGVSSGPKGVTDGIVSNLDIRDRRTFAGNSLLTMDDWTVGTGSTGNFGANQTVGTENQRLLDTDPWGYTSLVWQSNPSGDGNNDGGWNSASPAIDRTQLYRFSVWMRRISATTGGTFYYGMNCDGAGPKQCDTSAVQTNPYWEAKNIASYTQNLWYLAVGHVYPWDTTVTGKHPQSGMYTIAGGPVIQIATSCNIGAGDLKWNTDTTTAYHRTYHYYCAEATSHLQFYAPRIDQINGQEPSLATLMLGPDRLLRDSRGPYSTDTSNSNANINAGSMRYCTPANGYLTLDGSSSYIDLGNPTVLRCTSVCSVSAWINPTSGAGGGNIYSKNYNGGFRTRITSNNSLWLYCSANTITTAASVAPNGTWKHAVFVADKTGLKIYVNGVLVQSNTTPFDGSSMASGGTYIGQSGVGDEFFNGKISQLKVFAKTLTPSEILQEFYATRGRYGV